MSIASVSKALLSSGSIVLTVWGGFAHAQETALQQYEVELLVFRVNNPAGTPEDWSLEEVHAKTSLPQTAEAEDTAAPVLEPPVATPPAPGTESSIQPLAGGPTRLAAIEVALRRNRAYTPVAHIGWTQPGFAINNPRPLAMEAFLPTEAGITGTSSLVRGRYLHLSLELTLVSPIDGKKYVLREQRRMRSGDKHYFDHPHFGVIALITPKDGR